MAKDITEEPPVEVQQFAKYLVIENPSTKITERNDKNALTIEYCADTNAEAMRWIKEMCEQNAQNWEEHTIGKKRFFSHYGIYKLETVVRPSLEIKAIIRYPEERE